LVHLDTIYVIFDVQGHNGSKFKVTGGTLRSMRCAACVHPVATTLEHSRRPSQHGLLQDSTSPGNCTVIRLRRPLQGVLKHVRAESVCDQQLTTAAAEDLLLICPRWK